MTWSSNLHCVYGRAHERGRSLYVSEDIEGALEGQGGSLILSKGRFQYLPILLKDHLQDIHHHPPFIHETSFPSSSPSPKMASISELPPEPKASRSGWFSASRCYNSKNSFSSHLEHRVPVVGRTRQRRPRGVRRSTPPLLRPRTGPRRSSQVVGSVELVRSVVHGHGEKALLAAFAP